MGYPSHMESQVNRNPDRSVTERNQLSYIHLHYTSEILPEVQGVEDHKYGTMLGEGNSHYRDTVRRFTILYRFHYFTD